MRHVQEQVRQKMKDWDAESRLTERIRELKLVKSSAELLIKANQKFNKHNDIHAHYAINTYEQHIIINVHKQYYNSYTVDSIQAYNIRLVGWGLTALLTQDRSYRACRFVGIFYRKLMVYLSICIHIHI